jgi:hypothetical protein
MNTPDHNTLLESQIEQWRTYLLRRQTIKSSDVAELEDHLREQVSGLMDNGLAPDEAFLVSVKRIGNLDSLSREFAVEHSDRLWKQLVVPSSADGITTKSSDGLVALAFAVGAAALVKLPALFGIDMAHNDSFYARNASLFVLPMLTGFFVWKRRVAMSTVRWLALAVVAAIIFANVYPFTSHDSDTLTLSAVHLPVALWMLVGVAYAGSRWGQVAGRMDFIRFSGEFLIYFVLIALGGGLLTGLLVMLFKTIGIDAGEFVGMSLVPSGAAGAVIIASWLLVPKQSVIENMAPVLARLFTPLFTLLLIVFLGTLVFTGKANGIERTMLLQFNALLVLVLALVLYSISARDEAARPGPFDVMQVVLVICALLADLLALWNIAARISEFGFTPNRVAVLGMNLILLINLAWSAVLYVRFVRNSESLLALERWQTRYLPVFAAWAAIVVIVFPPLFHYI